MRRIHKRFCLSCGLAGHMFKECRKHLIKEPMRPAAREKQLQQHLSKTSAKKKFKQKPQVAIREPLNPNWVFGKVNGHPALALIYVQTIRGVLISAQFVYLYKLTEVKIQRNTLATAIKGCQVTVDKTSEVSRNWGGYEKPRMFFEAYLSGWDMMLGKPGLQDVLATIWVGTLPVTIQPPWIDRFSLCMWRGNCATDQKSDLSRAANSILVWRDMLAVTAAERENQFIPVADFAALFPKRIPRELPPLRNFNHKVKIISGSSCIPT